MQTSPHTAIMIGKELGDVANSTLRFFKQLGVEAVGMPRTYNTKIGTPPTVRPLVPPTQSGLPGPLQVWDETEMRRVKAQIEAFELLPWLTSLPLSANILMGLPRRDADIEQVQAHIRLAGRLGLKVLIYNFTALRASEGYGALPNAGRGGAHLRDYDEARIRNLPPLDSVGEHTMDDMWARLTYFLQAVVPVAEQAGVRLACHPNDPPVASYRGVAQPLHNLAGWKRLIEVVNSPANTLFFDTGVTTEIGEDALEVVHYFGSRERIGNVHFRNVRVDKPGARYVETFHDDGDCDMDAAMRALHDVGYNGMIDPDHTPYLLDDTPDTRLGWAFAIGQMVAWRKAAQT